MGTVTKADLIEARRTERQYAEQEFERMRQDRRWPAVADPKQRAKLEREQKLRLLEVRVAAFNRMRGTNHRATDPLPRAMYLFPNIRHLAEELNFSFQQ